jgi:hypothetical protein
MANKQPFNLANYIRNQNMPGKFGGAAAGQWGIPDPAGTARGRLAQFRRGLVGIGVAQNPVEEWAMGSLPGKEASGISAGMKAYTEKKKAAAAKYEARQTMNQATRAQAVADMNPAEQKAWRQEQEGRRLSSFETQNRTGWSTQRTLDFMANGIPSSTGKYLQAGRSPAEQESYMETIQDKFDIVNQALWRMAMYSGMSRFTDLGSLPGINYDTDPTSPTYMEPIIKNADDQKAYDAAVASASQSATSDAVEKFGRMQSFYYTWNTTHNEDWATLQDINALGVSRLTDEGKAETQAYRAFVIQNLQWKGIPNVIINMALSTKTPMPLANMIDFGFLKVGQILTATQAKIYGYDLPENVTSVKIILRDDGTTGLEQSYGPTPTTEAAPNVSTWLGQSEETTTQPSVPEEGVTTTGVLTIEPTSGTFISGGEEFRSGRDWSQPQILSATEAKYYFDIEGELPTDFTMTAQEIDGKMTILSKTSEGWTTNFGADGVNTWVSPEGEVFNSQEEVTTYVNQQVEDASRAYLEGGNTGAVINEWKPSTPWKDPNTIVFFPNGNETLPGTLTPAGFTAGQELVLVSVPKFQDNIRQIVSLTTPPVVNMGSSQWGPSISKTTIPQQPTLSLTPAGGEGEYKTYEFISPIVVNGSTIGIDVVSNGIDGFTNNGDVLASYLAPTEFDPNNLPSFIIQSGGSQFIDISTNAGKVYLKENHPDLFFRLIRSQGKTTANEKMLREDFGLTNQEIDDFWKGKPFGYTYPEDDISFSDIVNTIMSPLMYAAVDGPADLVSWLIDPFGENPNEVSQIHDFLTKINPVTAMGEGFASLKSGYETIGALIDYGTNNAKMSANTRPIWSGSI